MSIHRPGPVPGSETGGGLATGLGRMTKAGDTAVEHRAEAEGGNLLVTSNLGTSPPYYFPISSGSMPQGVDMGLSIAAAPPPGISSKVTSSPRPGERRTSIRRARSKALIPRRAECSLSPNELRLERQMWTVRLSFMPARRQSTRPTARALPSRCPARSSHDQGTGPLRNHSPGR
jgi:hypothetical protein